MKTKISLDFQICISVPLNPGDKTSIDITIVYNAELNLTVLIGV